MDAVCCHLVKASSLVINIAFIQGAVLLLHMPLNPLTWSNPVSQIRLEDRRHLVWIRFNPCMVWVTWPLSTSVWLLSKSAQSKARGSGSLLGPDASVQQVWGSGCSLQPGCVSTQVPGKNAFLHSEENREPYSCHQCPLMGQDANRLTCPSEHKKILLSFLWGWSNADTGCPGMLWSLHPWRYSKLNWTQSWATCSHSP